MAPIKHKHHPSTLSDVGTDPVGPAGVVLEEWRAMRHFHALTRDRGLFVGSGSFATGAGRQQARPCPLCPGSDQIQHRGEMKRWARATD
jgi:hypothetical protein